VSEDDHTLALFDGDQDDDEHDHDPATVELVGRPAHEPSRWLRTRWVVLAFAVLVVVALTVGIIVFNASAPTRARGAKSATVAAQGYVAALNAGDGAKAAQLACDDFADEARADARSGADPGISYTLSHVTSADKNNAIAAGAQHLKIAGGTTQNEAFHLSLVRSSGLWLICGRAT
jgi:uncharacterized membrane protein